MAAGRAGAVAVAGGGLDDDLGLDNDLVRRRPRRRFFGDGRQRQVGASQASRHIVDGGAVGAAGTGAVVAGVVAAVAAAVVAAVLAVQDAHLGLRLGRAFDQRRRLGRRRRDPVLTVQGHQFGRRTDQRQQDRQEEEAVDQAEHHQRRQHVEKVPVHK